MDLGYDTSAHIGKRLASVDGDADRLVYYYVNKDDDSFNLLDGDAIAVLAGRFIHEQLEVYVFKNFCNDCFLKYVLRLSLYIQIV